MNGKLDNLSFPLIQGGMGVGISLSGLAGAVAKEGCIGVLSSAYIGINQKDFEKDRRKESIQAIRIEIEKARKISQGNGLIGINIMCALRDYEAHVKESLESGVDAIISGAGLPLKLPDLAKGYDVLLIPIVSSQRVTKLICEYWQKKYNRLPDAIIIEGKKAGGHLGYSYSELEQMNDADLLHTLREVKKYLSQDSIMKDIPVFVAGGITDSKEVEIYLKNGANGIQVGTAFAISKESDASKEYKEILIKAKTEDTLVIQSPVGLPARAIKTPYLYEKTAPRKCIGCLKTCKGLKAEFCLSEALIAAVKGNLQKGVFFTGSEIGKFNESLNVQEIIKQLFKERQ